MQFIPTAPRGNSKNFPQNESIYARQIAFAAAFLLPAARFLEAPSILAKYATGDILLPALLHFLMQTLVLLAVLYAASRSEKSLLQRLQEWLGKGIFVVYIAYAAYFLFAVILPVFDLEKYVYAAFFDTSPTMFSFAVFFFFSAYVCTKGIKNIGRSADLCLLLFLLPFFALIVMSFPEAKFSNLLPLFGSSFSGSAKGFAHTAPHFSDAVLLLPLIANLRYREYDGVKITVGYTCGAAFTLLFIAVFYGVYSSLAPREHYAFSKIAQYFPALSVVGRIDLIFVYLLSIVLLFYTCLPLQYATDLLARTFHSTRKTWISAILNFLLLLLTLYFNKNYDSFYRVISDKLQGVFWLFADILPLLLLLVPLNRGKEKKNA